MTDSHRPVEPESSDQRFDGAFRRWAGRPPATPADEAARKILARLPSPRADSEPSRRPRWIVALAASLIAVLGLALLVGRIADRSLPPKPEVVDPPVTSAVPDPGSVPPPEPPGDVLVIGLDPRTTLYLNLAAPAGASIP